ncbi:hypothetical protein D3C76_1268270 [compost metagenome]
MNGELIVTVVVRDTQFIRELAAVGLHDISNTSAECAFDAGQLLKHFITRRVACITQPLLVHFIGVLCQHGTRRATGVYQLVSNGITAVRVRGNLTHDYRINTQRGPCRRLQLSSSAWLLWQTGTV